MQAGTVGAAATETCPHPGASAEGGGLGLLLPNSGLPWLPVPRPPIPLQLPHPTRTNGVLHPVSGSRETGVQQEA